MSHQKVNVKILSIEGNIGSGKTTLLKKLKEVYAHNSQVIFLNEPVHEWETIKDANGQTMLQKFYENQEKYSFPFQMMAYISRLKILKNTVDALNECYSNSDKKFIIITERSLFTDKYVFAQMLYDQGKIEDVCFQIYLNWFNTFIDTYPVSELVYVNTDPKICYDRIHIRSRQGEEVISLDYLTQCDEYHTKFINISVNNYKNKLITLDGNNNIYKNPEILNKWLTEINNLLFL